MYIENLEGFLGASRRINKIMQDHYNGVIRKDILNRRTGLLKEKSKINILKYRRV